MTLPINDHQVREITRQAIAFYKPGRKHREEVAKVCSKNIFRWVVSIAIITTTVIISHFIITCKAPPVLNKKSDATYMALTQEAVRDLGDGFLTKERHGFVLVKFPGQYLDSEDHFKQGFAIALFKLYGSIYENVKVSISDDLITGVGKDDVKIVAETMPFDNSDKTIVGVIFPKP